MSSIDIVRTFYTALAERDVGPLSGLFADSITWTEAEGFPYHDGTWTTFADVEDKLLRPVGRDWDAFAATPAEFLATEDGRVVTLGAYSGTFRATGKPMRAAFAHLWRVSDGKIASFDMYTDTLLVARAMAGGSRR